MNEIQRATIQAVLEKLQNGSTWSGILKIAAGLFGVTLSPDTSTQVACLLVAASGLASMYVKEHKTPTPTAANGK